MRKAFIDNLIEIARNDRNTYLLTGDVGYKLLDDFRDQLPDQFMNTGISEQNMMGIATGLALSGKTVFTYSLVNFSTIRCLEQIRNDVCYHNCNVNIVISGGGLIYGALGVTHHTTEDLALLRALPNMTVIAPGDPVEAGLATKQAAGLQGPCYLRLGRTGDPVVHQTNPDFQIGKAIKVREGGDVTLIAAGGILHNVARAAEQLANDGIKPRVLSMHTVKPIDKEALISAAEDTAFIISIEEHNITGGLGSALLEILSEAGYADKMLLRMGIQDKFTTDVGNQDYLLNEYSLSVEGIVDSVKNAVKRGK